MLSDAEVDHAEMSGRFTFGSIQEVEDWVRKRGVGALHRALAEGVVAYPISEGNARSWLELHDREMRDAHAAEQLDIDRRAAQSAERAARWAMWSALISATVGVVSAAAYWLSRMPG